MESESDKTPLKAEQKEELTALTSTPECHEEEPMESNEQQSLSERGNKRKYDPAPCTSSDATDVCPTQEKKRNVEPPGVDHQISFTNPDKSNTAETKPHGDGMETEISVAGTFDEEQATAVSEKSTVKETLEEETSLAGSSSDEQISIPVVVIIDESEDIKQAEVEEITGAKSMTENVQRPFTSEETTNVDDQSSFAEGDKGGETGSVAVYHPGQKTNENVMRSNEPDFAYVKENISEVAETGNSDQISSCVTEDESTCITNVAETADEESQPPTLVSENTSVEEKSPVGTGNEFNIYDTEHIVYGCTEQTSNSVQPFLQGSNTNLENIVTLESAESGQLFALLPGMENYLDSPAQDESVSENSSNESSNIHVLQSDQENAGRLISSLDHFTGDAETILKHEVSIVLGLNELSDEFDEFSAECMLPDNVGDEQTTQVQQSLGTNDDANVEAGDLVGEDMKAKTPENVEESTQQEEPKENPNTGYKGRGSGCSRKRKAEELSETKEAGKRSQANASSYDEKADDEKSNDGKNADKKTDNEKTFTVIFHAMLSNNFKLDDYTQFEIRGEEPVFNGWEESGKMVVPKRNVDNQLLLQCEVKVPLKHASLKCAYKYVLLDKKDETTWEYLFKLSLWDRRVVNRCLVVGQEFARKNQTIHKYDGFIYPEPSTWSLVWESFFSSESFMIDRRTFFQTFFPRWVGFFVHSIDSEIQPVEALLKLDSLVEGVSFLWASTSGRDPYCYRIDSKKT